MKRYIAKASINKYPYRSMRLWQRD